MLLRNDLLQYTHPSPRTVRILWIAPEQSHAYVFDVAARSADVELIQLSALLADIRSGHASVLPADPFLMVVSAQLLPAKHLQLRARAWDIIGPLVALEPGIYEARQRGQLIAQATAAHGVSHPTIYRYLRRYWQRGQTPNALLPDYGNSGGKGKVRQASAGVKRGRPRKNGAAAGPGVNADEDMRRTFRVAIARYAAGHAKFSRLGAYQQMLADFFTERRIDAAGRVHAAAPGQGGQTEQGGQAGQALPTFGQFNYWLDHDDDRPPEVSRRSAATAATAMLTAAPSPLSPSSPLSSNSPLSPNALLSPTSSLSPSSPLSPPLPAMLPPGRPGAGFYLSAVRAEVQLVSRADRQQAIGRPLIYLVLDAFSRLVTGVYIGMGAPGWTQAMLALAHCGADKQRYSQQFGRRIDAGQWPCRHLPETLYVQAALTDGTQHENGQKDGLLNNFNLRCIAVDDGPDDCHGALDKRFRLLAPDAVGDAGAAASRLDGVLDLDQFTRIVIDAILYYNNRQPLRHAGGATARQLWDWGVAYRGGGLKTYPEHLIRCSLMPVAAAAVSGDGLLLFGGRYTCARAIHERWFERARLRGGWSVNVAYDPANLDMVYLLDPAAPMQFHACHLADDGGARRQLSAAEIALLPAAGGAAPAAPLRTTTHSFASFAG